MPYVGDQVECCQPVFVQSAIEFLLVAFRLSWFAWFPSSFDFVAFDVADVMALAFKGLAYETGMCLSSRRLNKFVRHRLSCLIDTDYVNT